MSGDVVAHLAAALAHHSIQCRRDGVGLPAGWLEVARRLADWASEGQEGPALDVSGCRCHGAAVDDPLLLTKPQAADLLGVSLSTLKRMVADGELPVVRVGGAVRIRRADLDAFVAGLAGPVAGRVQTKAPGAGPVPAVAVLGDPARMRRLDGFDVAGGRAGTERS